MRKGVGELEEGARGGVGALRVGYYTEDVQGGGRIVGEETEDALFRLGDLAARLPEHRDPPVPPPMRGDVDDQSGAAGVVGVFTPELGGEYLCPVGVESAVVELDRRARPDPHHQEVAGGRNHRVGAAGDLREQVLHAVVEQFQEWW